MESVVEREMMGGEAPNDHPIFRSETVQLTVSSSHSQDIAKIAFALAKAQGAMESAVKAAQNPFFRATYAALSDVWDACREPLSTNEIAVIQLPETDISHDAAAYEYTTKTNEKRFGVKALTRVTVVTMLVHSSGEWFKNSLSTVLPVADAQVVGAAITYMRRYALAPMVGVAPADDDGNSTTTNGNGQSHPQQTPAKPEAWSGPETVKQVRPVKYMEGNEQKVYWVVSTDRRSYITTEQTTASSLEKLLKHKVEITPEMVSGKLRIVEFSVVREPTS